MNLSHNIKWVVVTAFLYGFVDADTYVSQPDGFIEDFDLVCHLLKALYGLKQAPRVWYGVIRDFSQISGVRTYQLRC